MQYNGMLGTNRPVYLGDVSRLMCRELAIYVASTLNYVQKIAVYFRQTCQSLLLLLVTSILSTAQSI